MAFEVKELRAHQHAQYLTIEDSDELNIVTCQMYFPEVGNKNNTSVTFEIKRSMDEALYKKIAAFECRVAKTLKTLKPELLSELSAECQKVLSGDCKNLQYNVRSNYYGFQGDPKMYLKGNWSTTTIVNFNNEPITADVLAAGTYQFVIRANMVYIGSHKNPDHIANLQLRIKEIRYDPIKAPKTKTKRASKRKVEEDVDNDNKKHSSHSSDTNSC